MPKANKNKTQSQHEGHTPTVGDWIETRGLPGKPSRRGEIVEVLGAGDRVHFRVRWDERHESIVYPADGVIVTAAHDAKR
jgi:uncharacterized protein DUF1918